MNVFPIEKYHAISSPKETHWLIQDCSVSVETKKETYPYIYLTKLTEYVDTTISDT